MKLNSLHIYTVSFKLKAPLPSTQITYHVHNVVADTEDLAISYIKRMFNGATITKVSYNCTAMEVEDV